MIRARGMSHGPEVLFLALGLQRGLRPGFQGQAQLQAILLKVVH